MWTSDPAGVLLSLLIYIGQMSATIQSFHSSCRRYMSLSIMARAFPKAIHKKNERVALVCRKGRRVEELGITVSAPPNATMSSAKRSSIRRTLQTAVKNNLSLPINQLTTGHDTPARFRHTDHIHHHTCLSDLCVHHHHLSPSGST